eukprot:1743286-Prymnesium_polylepis.2
MQIGSPATMLSPFCVVLTSAVAIPGNRPEPKPEPDGVPPHPVAAQYIVESVVALLAACPPPYLRSRIGTPLLEYDVARYCRSPDVCA